MNNKQIRYDKKVNKIVKQTSIIIMYAHFSRKLILIHTNKINLNFINNSIYIQRREFSLTQLRYECIISIY
jgi:hypothetical protein